MAFAGKNFVFDGTPSETYNLFVSNTESGDVSINASSNVDIISESIYAKSVPYFYGAAQREVLTFPLFVSSPEEIDAGVAGKISSWLFGQREYKKLQIYQSDLLDVYFNAFLTSPRARRVGNRIVGYDFTVTCDSPFAWMFPQTETYSYTTELVDDDVVIQNISDNSDYLYMEMEITINGFGGSVTVTNNSDDGRIFGITGLTAGEVLTVDNDRGILTSSLDLRRLGSFNKNWFRLIQNKNEVNISGNVESIEMTYNFARKVT